MFARNSFPIRPPVRAGDGLSEMAHAMGCGTLVDEDRQMHPAFMVRDGNTWLVDRRPPAAPRQYR